MLHQLEPNPARPNWITFTLLPAFLCVCSSAFAFLASTVYNLLADRGLYMVLLTELAPEADAAAAAATVDDGVVPPYEIAPEKYFRF